MTRIAWGVLAAVSLQVAAESLEDRIKPAGSVCMSGESCAAAPVQVAANSGPRSGKDVYDSKCATCHATGAAGAPKLGDAAAWAPRVGKGIDVLYTSAISGFNGMPAKGLCFDCSDDEIKGSVDYMVDNSK
nr:c-type cytochrome [Agarilytica rhodophyticola]